MIRNERARLLIAAVAVVAPARLRRFLLTAAFGYRIHPRATVGRSLITVGHLEMGAGARIGSLNLLRHVDRVEMAEDTSIGHLNWISAARRERGYFADLSRDPALVMARGSALTHRHYVDCCDRVEIGELSTVGGIHCQILTHGVDVAEGALMAAPVRIEDRVLVCSAAILIAGCVVPSRAVVGAGAVVKGKLPDSSTLYAGPAATVKRALSPDSGYFIRERPHLY
jgi:carbonic anhydrase/acetyltransferase-like protein (isoleucine patch superfamily)